MYKTRIASWGLDKKFKKHEAIAMLVLLAHHKAKGNTPTFKLRDREIKHADLSRYARRAHITVRDLHGLTPIEAHQLAPDLVCVLSSQPLHQLEAPDQFKRFEGLFKVTQTYIAGAIESGLCSFDSRGYLCWEPEFNDWQEVRKVPYLLSLGNSMYQTNEMQIAGSAWRSAFAGMEAVVRCLNPNIWFEILLSRYECLVKGSEEVATHMGTYLSSLIEIMLTEDSPQRQLAKCMSALDIDDLQAVIPSYCELFENIWEKELSPMASLEMHLQSYTIGLSWRMNASMELTDPEVLLKKLGLGVDQLDGCTLTLYLYARWMCAHVNGNEEKAVQVASELVEAADSLPLGPGNLQIRIDALQCLARSCLAQGDGETVRSLLEEIHELNDKFQECYGGSLTVELEAYDIHLLLDTMSESDDTGEQEPDRPLGLRAIEQRLADELAGKVGSLTLGDAVS